MTVAFHLMAGLNGAGKTTLARSLESSLPAVRFTLDEWMIRLYDLAYDDPAYPERAAACRDLIWDLAGQVVRAGTSVVLDWNFWSRERRADAVHRADLLEVKCHLHHVVTPLEVAIERAEVRRDPTAHDLDAEAVRHLSQIFEGPGESEGFVLHRAWGVQRS